MSPNFSFRSNLWVTVDGNTFEKESLNGLENP